MTAKSSRRVVIINNIKSDKIEQAIFILKGSYLQKPDRGIIREAQNIIDEYIMKVEGESIINGIGNGNCEKHRVRAGIVTALIFAVLICLIFAVRKQL